MATIDQLLGDVPEPLRTRLRDTWDNLPNDVRQALEAALAALPGDLSGLKTILYRILDSYKPLFEKHTIAIVGPTNVGKTTLYNSLVKRDEDKGAVSNVPGTTRDNRAAHSNLFTLVDTPGADAVGAVGQREREIAFSAVRSSDFLVVMFDAIQGVKNDEKRLFDDLLAEGKPFVVLLNKIDLVPSAERERVLKSAAANLGIEPKQIIDTAATNGHNVGRVILAIAAFEPGLLGALGDAVPQYQAQLAWQRIVPAATTAAAIGWVPLPFADVIPLLAVQSGMILSIARVYGYHITPGRAKELIVAFGMGFAARYAFQELSKLAGIPGWVLAASIAAATTAVMGVAAMVWFQHGERPSQENMQKLTKEVTALLVARLRSLGDRLPGKAALNAPISEAIAQLQTELQPKLMDDLRSGSRTSDSSQLGAGTGPASEDADPDAP